MGRRVAAPGRERQRARGCAIGRVVQTPAARRTPAAVPAAHFRSTTLRPPLPPYNVSGNIRGGGVISPRGSGRSRVRATRADRARAVGQAHGPGRPSGANGFSWGLGSPPKATALRFHEPPDCCVDPFKLPLHAIASEVVSDSEAVGTGGWSTTDPRPSESDRLLLPPYRHPRCSPTKSRRLILRARRPPPNRRNHRCEGQWVSSCCYSRYR
jgi:hypothetical protein